MTTDLLVAPQRAHSVYPIDPPPPGTWPDDLAAIASHYLSLALADGVLDPAEKAVQEALRGPQQDVVRALLKAGLSSADVVAYLGTVTGEEAANPDFIETLHAKLCDGLSAGDAILCARFQGHASEAELADPQFLKDLGEAGQHGQGGSTTDALAYARTQQLQRQGVDPQTIQKLRDLGLSLPQIGQATPAQREQLLQADPARAEVLHKLLDAGMGVEDALLYAGTVVTPQEATPEFLAKLRERLSQPNTSVAAAIAGARYGDQISADELADPEFLHDLLDAGDEWAGAREGQQALTLLQSLAYARDHVDIFEAAEKVTVPGSASDNKWFANAGVFKLAELKDDSAEWSEIEKTLGRTLSKDERNAAINAAKGLTENWGTLCAMAKDIGLTVREGTTDVLDFTQDNLDKLNTSPIIAKLGNGPTLFGLTGMNIISALDYARHHVDIFEAAEKVMVPDSHSDNGWFANAGVWQLSGMKTDQNDDKAWEQIELTIGHKLSTGERQDAINAAKALTENWGTLCAHAGEIGLALREGTTDVLDFKKDKLKNLDFTSLVPLLGGPTSADATNALKYARAKLLEEALRTDGQPTPGADLETLLKLSPDEINRLLKLDPAKVKTLLKERPLSEIAQLSPEQLEAISHIDPDLLRWLLKLQSRTLGEISKLTTGELGELQEAMMQGYRQAGAQEDFDDILPESISHPIHLDGGMLIFQTQSGDKIIVTKDSNTDLYNKVYDLLQTRTQGEIDAIRKEFGLPPSAEVDVMNLPSNVLNDKDKPDSGYMTVGQLSIKTLMDKYREMIKKGEITHDDPRAQLVRAFEAANALGQGYKLLPYYEHPQGGGTTYRTYPGGEDNPTFQDMSPEDVEAILNEGKVSERIGELLQDPTIQADYQAALNGAVGTLPNKQELIDKLYNALTGTAYTDALKALRAKGLSFEAEQMIQRDLSALSMLDPAKAVEAGQKLNINSFGADFQALMDDPSLIDDETFNQAVTDAIAVTIRALRLGAFVVGPGAQTTGDMIKYLEETLKDKKSVEALSDTVKQLVIDAKSGKTVNLANITQAQFDEAMAKTYVPLELRGKLSNFFATTQKFGVWGAIGAGGALASLGYKLSKGAWDSDSTALERWGAARDIIAFMSLMGPTAKAATGFIDYCRTLLGADPNSQLAFKALGLDRTLPQVWGQDSFLPQGQTWEEFFSGKKPETTPPGTPPDSPPRPNTPVPETPRTSGEYTRALSEEFDNIFRDYDATYARNWDKLDLSTNEKLLAQQAADHLAEIWKDVAPEELTKLGNMAQRIGVSTLKVLGTVTDLAGIADIVVGALGLKKAIGENDVAGIITNSVGIASGAAFAASGFIGTVSLFAAVPAAMATAAAPLFVVGAVLALGGLFASLIVQAIKRHNHLQGVSDDQGRFFSDLAKDGLAYGDWGDRLEFIRYSFAIYGNDNPDPSKSYFEYQAAEWAHFQNTPGEDGSSVNRLDRGLHVINDKTWKDPFEEDETSYAA